MIFALLILAVLCGCGGAWRGNRTSIALLASIGLSSLFIALGVPFLMPVWLMIDLGVIALVLTGGVKCSDVLVLSLFFAAWPLYPSVGDGDLQASEMVNLIVAVQLILSAPWRWALSRLNLRPADLSAEGDFLRVRHGAT